MNENQIFEKVIENLKKSEAANAINKILSAEGGENFLRYIIHESIEVITDEMSNE